MKPFTLLKKSQWALICMALFLTGCFDNNDDVTVKNPPLDKPSVEIDWSTFSTTNLNVIVDDEFDGQYYYTIEAFITNPLTNPGAKMLSGSTQKTNGKVSYSRNISVPNGVETLYIRETNPFGLKRIYAVKVNGATTTLNLATAFRGDASFTAPETPTVSFDVPADAITLSSGGNQTFATGKSYYLPAGSTIDGILTFPGKGNMTLYVEGRINWKSSEKMTKGVYENDLSKRGYTKVTGPEAKGVTLNNSIEIIVLDGGVVTSDETLHIMLNGKSSIIIEKGGTFGLGEEFVLRITNTNKFVNYGAMNLDAMILTQDANVFNMGTINTNYFECQNMTNNYVNAGTTKADVFYMNNGKMYNLCSLFTDLFFINSNAHEYLAAGSYIWSEDFFAAGTKITMDALSLWESERATWGSQSSSAIGEEEGDEMSISSEDVDYALFKTGILTNNATNNVLTCSGRIEIACDEFIRKTDVCYSLNGNARFAEGLATAVIPTSDCNAGSNNNDGDGEMDPSSEDGYVYEVVYMFEDEWPNIGDYDMNDVVLGVKLRNKNIEDKVIGVTLEYTVYAAGGTYKVGAGFILDGITASMSSDAMIEQGVFKMFESAHAALKAPEGKPANVTDKAYPPQTYSIDVAFTQYLSDPISTEILNMFILVGGDFSANEWKEVHLPGFVGTSRAMTDSNSTEYYQDEKGWMWGLCVIAEDFASYPKEMVSITGAYPDFTADYTNGFFTPFWYMDPIDDKVIKWSAE